MYNIRNSLKLLIKVEIDDFLNLNISKTSSIISQYGIEEANLVDEYLNYYFLNNFKSCYLKNKIFFIRVNILIFKDEEDTEFTIQTISKNFLLKKILDEKLTFSLLNSFWINLLTVKQNYFYNNFISNLKTFFPTTLTFKNRVFLKNRKINFRRKIKKDLFNE